MIDETIEKLAQVVLEMTASMRSQPDIDVDVDSEASEVAFTVKGDFGDKTRVSEDVDFHLLREAAEENGYSLEKIDFEPNKADPTLGELSFICKVKQAENPDATV